MIDFDVDLVEEHVDLDGPQFSGSILERWYSARTSQRNVVVLARHDQQRIFPVLRSISSSTLNVSLS